MTETAIIEIPPDDELPAIPPTRQKNIPIETIIELHNKDLSAPQIAKIVGCCHQNITNRLSTSGISSLRHYKKNRADVFASLQSKILNNIDNASIKKASMLQQVTAAGILYDKERLEQDKSTSNVSIHADIAAIKARKVNDTA